MAGLLQAGAQASTPAAPEFRFAYHTREGVVDKSAAVAEAGKAIDMGVATEGLKAANELVPQIYLGHAEARLTNRLNAEAINPFLEARGEPLQTQGAINEKAENSAEVAKMAPGAFKSFNQEMARFKQGRATRAEFEINTRKILREEIAKNPGLSQQLIKHAQQVEYLSGVRSIADPKNDLAKQEAKQQEFIIKDIAGRAKAVFHDYDTRKLIDDPIYQQYTLEQVMEKERNKAVFEATKDRETMANIRDTMTSKQAEGLLPSWKQGNVQEVVSGINNVVEVATNINTEAAKKQALQDLISIKTNAMFQLQETMSKSGINATVANQTTKQHEDTLNDYIKIATDHINGDTDAKMYKNNTSIRNDFLKLQSLNIINPHNVKAIKDLNLGLPEMVEAVMKNPTMLYTLTGGLQDLMNGVSSQNAMELLTQRNLGRDNTDAAAYLENGFNKIATGDDSIKSSTNQFLSGISSATIALKDKMQGMDINQRIEAQRNIVNVIGMAKYKDVQVMDEEGKRHAHNITTDFMQYAGRAFNQRASALREDGYKINTEFMPNGQMMITSPDAPKNIVDDLNRKYASAWNSGVKSMSNIYKNTWKDASGMIVDLQGATWGISPGTNPIEGVVPETAQKKSRTTLEPELRSFAVDEANKAGLDPSLVLRVIQQESGGDVGAISKKGAKGLMQLMPATAKDLGVNENDPYDNIRGGVKYLKQQMDKYKDPKLALAAYNAGPGAVDKHNGMPPFKETQDYVKSILGE